MTAVYTHTFAYRRKRWRPYRHAVTWLDGHEWETACGRRVREWAGTLEHAPESELDCGACRRALGADADLIGAWTRA